MTSISMFVSTMLGLAKSFLYEERSFKLNLQLSIFFSDPDNIELLEHHLHQPITRTLDGLTWNFSQLHLTQSTEDIEEYPGSYKPIWFEKVIADQRLDLVEPWMTKETCQFRDFLNYDLLMYAQAELYKYLMVHVDILPKNVRYCIAVGAGMLGHGQLIEAVLTQFQDSEYQGAVFIGGLFGGRTEVMDDMGQNNVEVSYLRVQWLDNYGFELAPIPIEFQSYEGLRHFVTHGHTYKIKIDNLISLLAASLLKYAPVAVLDEFDPALNLTKFRVQASISFRALKWFLDVGGSVSEQELSLIQVDAIESDDISKFNLTMSLNGAINHQLVINHFITSQNLNMFKVYVHTNFDELSRLTMMSFIDFIFEDFDEAMTYIREHPIYQYLISQGLAAIIDDNVSL